MTPAAHELSISPLGGEAEKILQSFGVPPSTSGNRLSLIATG